jgi:hypothetical protein
VLDAQVHGAKVSDHTPMGTRGGFPFLPHFCYNWMIGLGLRHLAVMA